MGCEVDVRSSPTVFLGHRPILQSRSGARPRQSFPGLFRKSGREARPVPSKPGRVDLKFPLL